jgi:hypothetical protein
MMSDSHQPTTVIFEAEVYDGAGHAKSFSLATNLEPENYYRLMMDPFNDIPMTNYVIEDVVHRNVPRILQCGIDWRCAICGASAIRSVNNPSLENDQLPPKIVDTMFVPICSKVSCKSQASRGIHEAYDHLPPQEMW